jgi:flagellar assembly factor FliW
LSFVCAPLPLVSPNYDMVLPRQDCEALALSADCRSQASKLDWLVILCFARPEEPTANLLGPVVIRRDVGLGVQSIREDARYSARQPLYSATAPQEQASC